MSIARRSPHLNVMVEAAEKAGRALVRDFGEVENLQVSRKGPGNFVSTADHKSEKTIVAALSKARPSYGFLMEEGGTQAGEDPAMRWIVDPLDGTTNFLHGAPHWCISIALEKDKEIVAGVIYDPVRDEMFWAEKGCGAYVNNRRIRVSSRSTLNEALLAVGTDSFAEIGSVAPAFGGVRRMGSACLDLAYVAAGRFDAYWEHGLQPWDKAAGGLIAKEAGALVTSFEGIKGHDVVYGNSITAANPALHAELLKALKNQADKKVKSAS